MGQKPPLWSFRNHRDHRERLVLAGAGTGNGGAEKDAVRAIAPSGRQPIDAADRELPKIVSLDRARSSITDPADRPIRVLLAAGQALIRAGYRALLESDELIAVVGEAASAEDAVARATETRPDVALLDLALPGLDDFDATSSFISHPALTRVAVMLMAPSRCDERVLGGLLSGAAGVLAKDAEPAELIHAVQVVARGQAVLPVTVVRQLLSEQRAPTGHYALSPAQLDELTGREREVVALVAGGLSNYEIAARLLISPATAKTHVSRAMLKLGTSHRAQLVVLAYETGLVRPPSQGEAGFASV